MFLQLGLLQFLQALVVPPHTHERQVPVIHLQQLLVAIFTCRVNYRISSVRLEIVTAHMHQYWAILATCIKHTDTRTNEVYFLYFTFYTFVFVPMDKCMHGASTLHFIDSLLGRLVVFKFRYSKNLETAGQSLYIRS